MSAGDWLRLPGARAFFDALIDGEARFRWSAKDVLVLMCGECNLMPLDHPNAFGYEGLTQIGKTELRNLGWRVETMGAFCKAPPAVQVEYAGRYFEDWRVRLHVEQWTSPGLLWQCNLMPATIATPGAAVFDRDKWRKGWEANRWLDLNADGKVSTDELTQALLTRAVPQSQPRFDLAVQGLAAVRALRATPTLFLGDAANAPDMRDANRSELDDDPPPDAA